MTFFYSKSASGSQPPHGAMSGVWSGSWMLPSYYLVAYTDRHGYGPLDKVMKQPIDPRVVEDMDAVMSTCTVAGANDCLNTTFANATGLDPDVLSVRIAGTALAANSDQPVARLLA